MSTYAERGDIGEEARRWILATQDPSFDGWDSLSDWLEADPANLAAYEAAVDLDDWAVAVLTAPREAHAPREAEHENANNDNDNVVALAAPARSRRWFLGAGVAAAFTAVIGGWLVLNQINEQEIMTQPGQHRLVQLADGSNVKMNGGTTIRFDKRHPREVELASGEALFDVHHDASDPFVVMAGATRLVDAGTIFNVVSENGMLDVAVAHGAVIYEPGRADIRLDAGQALFRSAQNAAPVMRKAVIETVGSWREGTLQFDNASLEMVARDLERNTGLEVRADPSIRQQRFSGTLTVGGAVDEVFARVGPLLGVRFVPDGPAWKMMPAHGSRR